MSVFVQFLGEVRDGDDGLSVSVTMSDEDLGWMPDVFLSVKRGTRREDVIGLLDRIRALVVEHGIERVEDVLEGQSEAGDGSKEQDGSSGS